MKKIFLANFIAFIIGIYFIIRAFFWYINKNGNLEQNKFFASIYLSIGIIAILIQIIVNYIKRKK